MNEEIFPTIEMLEQQVNPTLPKYPFEGYRWMKDDEIFCSADRWVFCLGFNPSIIQREEVEGLTLKEAMTLTADLVAGQRLI